MKSELGWMLVEVKGNKAVLFPSKTYVPQHEDIVVHAGSHVVTPSDVIERPQSCHFVWPTLDDVVHADGEILARGTAVKVEAFYHEEKRHLRPEGHFIPDEVVVLYSINDKIAVNKRKGQ